MTDRYILPGKLTDLTDPRQLGVLNDTLNWLISVANILDPNAFALAWIEGFAAGAVIASKGVGTAPEWDTSPTLTGLKLSGLSASQMVVTDGAKNLSSMSYAALAVILTPLLGLVGSGTPSSTPSATPSSTPSSTPSATPSVSSTPSSTPSATPSATPSSTPSATPSATPSPGS